MKCYACNMNSSYAYKLVVEVAMCQMSYITACSTHINTFLNPWYKGKVVHLSSCLICNGIGTIKEIDTLTDKICIGCEGKCISARAYKWIKDNPISYFNKERK